MKFLHTGNFLRYNFDAFLRPRIFWLEIRTNSKGGVGALKLRNCHRGNVAEPDLWDLWAALELGACGCTYPHYTTGVKEMGGKCPTKNPKGFLGSIANLRRVLNAKSKHFLGI